MKNIKNYLAVFFFFVCYHLQAQDLQPLTHDDIVLLLSSDNISDDGIIKTIQSRKVSYALSHAQLIELVKLDAPEPIINAIENNPAVLISIENPRNNCQVPEGITVSGTVRGTKKDLWVLILPDLAFGNCWPQSDDASQGLPATVVNNRFSTRCNFGGPPQKYDIVVYSTDIPASNYFKNLLIKWSRDNYYPGLRLTDLPVGAVEECRITVSKK